MQGVQCNNCKNYLGENICSAFPDGIPFKFLSGEESHDKPLYEQENDIMFEEIENS